MPQGLTGLLNLIEEMPAYNSLLADLKQQASSTRAIVLDAAKPYLIAALHKTQKQPVLVVTAQPEDCKKLYEQLSAWSDFPVKLFPEPDVLPYERIVSDVSTEIERIQALSTLADCGNGGPDEKPPLIITQQDADFKVIIRRVVRCMR